MEERLRNFIKHNVLNTSEAASVLEVSRQRIKGLVDEGRLIPVKKNSNGYLFLRKDLLKLVKNDHGRNISSNLILFERSGITNKSKKFVLERINEIGEISAILIYFEGLDAAIDGYYQVAEVEYGQLHNTWEPNMIIKGVNGKELWVSACNCGYQGTSPNGTIEVLKELWNAGKINLDGIGDLEELIYNHKVVKIIQEKNKYVDVIKHQGSFSPSIFRLNEITADLYFFENNLVLLQSDTSLFDDDQIALLDKFAGFVPDPISIVVFPTQEEAVDKGYAITGYGLGDERIFQVIIRDSSGRQLWLNTLLFEDKSIEDQDSIINILNRCGIPMPEKSIPGKLENWINKVIRKEVPGSIVFEK